MSRSARSVFLSLLVSGFAFTAVRTRAAPPVPKVNWSPCYRELGSPFECAVVNVPLDHASPGTAAIQLAVARLPASDPAQRIGSLFLNPGGPGGSGVDFMLFVAPFLYTDEVRQKFDIVGFDPRGVRRSTAVRCFGTDRQWWFAPFPFPTTEAEFALWRQTDVYLLDACDQRAGRIVDHMTTADVARDLDLLREAVGDEGLTYAGFSYGSYLGVTYANLFPEKVRAIVVDGVLDPVAWATGDADAASRVPFSTRLRSDDGARATLEEFFRLCDAEGSSCAIAPRSSERFAALAGHLAAGGEIPIQWSDGSTSPFTYAMLIGATLGAMYDPFSWADYAWFLLFLESVASAATPSAARDAGLALEAFWQRAGFVTKRGFPRYENFAESFPAVACGDSDNPADWTAWISAAADADRDFGYFGSIWTWASSTCAGWPSRESRYAGPFTATTANPVLVASTRFDPATRYEGARRVASLLPNSRLLSVNGWGHTTLFVSFEADLAIASYLVRQELPPADAAYSADYVPFLSPDPVPLSAAEPPAATAASAAREGRARAMPALVPDAVRLEASRGPR